MMGQPACCHCAPRDWMLHALQDSSSFVREGEELSFLQLQARAIAVNQILLGFYDVPKSMEQPLQLVINPEVVVHHMLLALVMFNMTTPFVVL
jgi:hypothetical protein